MNNITEFLNKTDLSVAENIILSVITTIICSMMLPFIWTLIKKISKKVYRTIKGFVKYLIRLKKGKLTCKEMLEIEKSIKEGKKVSKRKLEIYNKEMGKMREVVKDIKLADFKVPIPPNILK